ncbi:MAG: ferritin family protein [Anaerolineae bacterium]
MDEWLDILTRAMKLEQDGREFYLHAATMTDDKSAQKMFRRLADDELHHYTYLQREYASLLCDDRWCVIPELETVERIDEEEPIFPPADRELDETLGENPTLEDVLLFALDAEDKSFKLYQESAKKVSDSEAKALFNSLASAEMGHFTTVMQRYESFFGYPR